MSELRVTVTGTFEQCLELRWEIPKGSDGAQPKKPDGDFKEYVVEMVLDRAQQGSKAPPKPAPDAMVKRVNMGTDQEGSIQNMPSGRSFLVAVVGKLRGGTSMRSPWVRAATLSPADRDKDLGNRDPNNVPRLSCDRCPCPQYVPFRFALNSSSSMRCRCCGCRFSDHVAQQVQAILKAREEKARTTLRRASVKPLPEEALEWDTRECSLWFWTDGEFHPREALKKWRGRTPKANGGAVEGVKGRVSVITPTTESRHEFHEGLWKCFEAQAWEDKELIVIETYVDEPSKFFRELATKDSRLVFVPIQRPKGEDWSIGLKRNLATHLAAGEFIANFDDDDLYAPMYLTSMLAYLENQTKYAVTLSSWFIYDQITSKWGFCDPIAWGLAKGMDLSHREVREKAYGYGFSYVFRRKAGLDFSYEDINLGEDYHFMSLVQHRRGEESVALYHDNFGICLHVQHGGNTSNSILLRDVQREEWCCLDVMELAPRFAEGSTAAIDNIFARAIPPSQRQRHVWAHTLHGDLDVQCAVSASASDFMACLRQQTGLPLSESEFSIYRVPPEDEAWEYQQDEFAIEVLGLSFLAKMPGAEHNTRPESACGRQWRALLEQARRPMLGQDRLGLRTSDLWLRQHVEEDEHRAEEDEEPPEEFHVVSATCQKSSVKKFFSTQGAVRVRLPVGADVCTLRSVIGRFLPPTAKIMAETKLEGLVLLKETDTVPQSVVFSDFKGQQSYYAVFSPRENRVAMKILKAFLLRPEVQAKIEDIEKAACGSNNKDAKHAFAICELLGKEAYPPILRHFGMPEDENTLQVTMHCMQLMHEDMTATYLWLETELLMRNQPKIQAAYGNLVGHCTNQGLPVPSLDEVGNNIW